MATTTIGKYTIVNGNSDENLIIHVNNYIAQGWRPIGGVTILVADNGVAWYQAMIHPNLNVRT